MLFVFISDIQQQAPISQHRGTSKVRKKVKETSEAIWECLKPE
jgi:hypothetical protein